MNQKLNNSQEHPTVNRQYKDRLFRMVFSRKEDLLSLYNAINGTSYSNPDDLEVATLENALYLSMKNDLAFLLDVVLNLYEHQYFEGHPDCSESRGDPGGAGDV